MNCRKCDWSKFDHNEKTGGISCADCGEEINIIQYKSLEGGYGYSHNDPGLGEWEN